MAFRLWVNLRHRTDRRTGTSQAKRKSGTPFLSSKQKKNIFKSPNIEKIMRFRWKNVFDDMRRMCRWSFWFWCDEDMCKNNFYIFVLQWPWPFDIRITPLFTSRRENFIPKYKPSITFQYWVNDSCLMYETDWRNPKMTHLCWWRYVFQPFRQICAKTIFTFLFLATLTLDL